MNLKFDCGNLLITCVAVFMHSAQKRPDTFLACSMLP